LVCLGGLAAIATFSLNASAQEIPHDAPLVYVGSDEPAQPLIAFDDSLDAAAVGSGGATASLVSQDDASGLLVQVTLENNQYPGVRLDGPEGGWDLSEWQYINMEVENLGDHTLRLGLRADNPGATNDDKLRVTAIDEFAPGESKTLSLRLNATEWALDPPLPLVGMRLAPGQSAIDPSQIEKLIVFSVRPEHDERFILRNVRAENRLTKFDSSNFLPFIDRYGQFVHDDWKGKIHSDADFAAHKAAEAKDLAAQPGPKSFNQYGGWADGPQLDATGSFRVAKHDGKWWLVDPDGRLFWSHGVDCIDIRFGPTGIEHREDYFAWLPDDSDPLAAHYKTNSGWAPHGFYSDKLPYRMYDFKNANLHRKYGDDWKNAYGEMAHQRLRSWGLNTIAAWGDPKIYRQQRTAYTAHVWISGADPIEGSSGYWGQFPDVFDPSYRKAVRKSISKYKQDATDPWNIGYYVDNEISWGNETQLAVAALTSPADQAAKLALIEVLQEHHRDIGALNAAWGTDYESWDGLAASRDKPPDIDRASPDLRRFYQLLCETYFRTIKEELKAVAPDKLYLGCRFAWKNDIVVWASAAYCDVVSYNIYKYSISDFRLPNDIDRPVMIGEFSFGAPDSGVFPTGSKARDQAHRGELYENYLNGALDNPQIVGTHWFQYFDEPASGRPDEENFNMGMVTVGDYPYAELVQSVREIGRTMYERRAE
jgi:hypothetical protein